MLVQLKQHHGLSQSHVRLRILNEINYLKHEFIFMSTVVILYILRFLSLVRYRFAYPSEEERHA